MEGINRKAGHWPITISETSTSKINVNVSKINVEMLSSFNWIWSEDGSSAIAVPSEAWEAQSYQGHPPRWELQIPSPRLPYDKESFFQREAISRHPHAFEPLFASLRICRPDLDFPGINLITQLNHLPKLFRYVRGKEQDAFRIDIELIDDSIHEPL